MLYPFLILFEKFLGSSSAIRETLKHYIYLPHLKKYSFAYSFLSFFQFSYSKNTHFILTIEYCKNLANLRNLHKKIKMKLKGTYDKKAISFLGRNDSFLLTKVLFIMNVLLCKPDKPGMWAHKLLFLLQKMQFQTQAQQFSTRALQFLSRAKQFQTQKMKFQIRVLQFLTRVLQFLTHTVHFQPHKMQFQTVKEQFGLATVLYLPRKQECQLDFITTSVNYK